MKSVLFLISVLFIVSCSKQKTVLICGDHVCINKAEAEQFFEDNLTIEVKIINKKKKEKFDLIELNLKQDDKEKKQVTLRRIDNTNKKLKTLSKNEINLLKDNIKTKENAKKIAKKNKKRNNDKQIKKISIKKENRIKKSKIIKKDKVVDICTIVKKCSMDEISKYLLKMEKKKDFPDITTRQ